MRNWEVEAFWVLEINGKRKKMCSKSQDVK